MCVGERGEDEKERDGGKRKMRMELEAEERRKSDQRQEEQMMHFFSTYLQQMSGVVGHAPFYYQLNQNSRRFSDYCTHPQDLNGPSSPQKL